MANLKATGCHFIVNLDIYYKDILFMFGYSQERTLSVLANFDGTQELIDCIKQEPLNYKGITYTMPNGATLILMPNLPTTSEHYGTLNHEIFHAVEGIMRNIGNPLRVRGNSESWAHMIGYVTAKVYEKLNPCYE